jgi:hypothetical protein
MAQVRCNCSRIADPELREKFNCESQEARRYSGVARQDIEVARSDIETTRPDLKATRREPKNQKAAVETRSIRGVYGKVESSANSGHPRKLDRSASSAVFHAISDCGESQVNILGDVSASPRRIAGTNCRHCAQCASWSDIRGDRWGSERPL